MNSCTRRERPLSRVHSIMMVNSAQSGEGGRCTPSPFHSIYHHQQSCGVYAPAKKADTLLLFLLYPFLLCGKKYRDVQIIYSKDIHIKHVFSQLFFQVRYVLVNVYLLYDFKICMDLSLENCCN